MTGAIKVMHIASGDLWAGAEVQAFTLMSHLAKMSGMTVSAIVMNSGTLATMLKAEGICVYMLDERSMTSLELLARIRAVLQKSRPDIVHTHRIKENILGSIANKMSRGVPCLRTVHGANERTSRQGFKELRQRAIYGIDRWCGNVLQHKIIAVTNELASSLKMNFAANKIVVIENGVDFERIRAAKGIAEFKCAAPDATHIGIVGRLVPVKRVDLFLEMASRLVANHRGVAWQFHIFGDGPLRQELEGLRQYLNLQNVVNFYGHRNDIATCIGGLDVLVNCSDHEGLPLSVLEALALSIPTVAHSVGGLIEVIPGSLLVTEHNAAGYSESVLKAVSQKKEVRDNAVDTHKLERFSAANNARRVNALYHELGMGSKEKRIRSA